MNATDLGAQKVWDHTLTAVRGEKRRRRASIVLLVPTAIILLSLLIFRHGETSTPARLAGPGRLDEGMALAVLVIRNGVPSLETLSADDLPNTELRLSLEPVLADYRDFSDEVF